VTGEQRQHLGQDVLHEVYGRVGRIQDVRVDAPVRQDFELLGGVAEPGVGGDRGLRVAGHLDLRHDGDEVGLRQRPARRLLHGRMTSAKSWRMRRLAFITVVPEIEMPGHAQAAIAAYPWLGNTASSSKSWRTGRRRETS